MVHLHPTPDELVARATQRAPMSRVLRATLLTVCALLWLSGALWLLLHWLFPAHNEFGALPNAGEAPLMRVHGLAAIVAVFLFGWVASGHVLVRWWTGANRISGLWLLVCAGLLVVSGYALYYSSGALHASASLVHSVLGILAIIAALVHWRHLRAAR
jgi:hypothetical protein